MCEYQSDFDFVHNLVSRIEVKDGDGCVKCSRSVPFCSRCLGFVGINRDASVDRVSLCDSFTSASLSQLLPTGFKFLYRREYQCGVRINDASGTTYDVNVTVVDVGPKSIKCIEKHQNRNRDALNAFVNYHRPNTMHLDSKLIE